MYLQVLYSLTDGVYANGEYRFTTNARFTNGQIALINMAKESDRYFESAHKSIDAMEDGDAKAQRLACEVPFVMSHALSHAFEAVGIFKPSSSYATNAKSATRKREAIAWKMVKAYLHHAQPSSGECKSGARAADPDAVTAAWTVRKAQKTRRENKALSKAAEQEVALPPPLWQRNAGERLSRALQS